MPEVITIDGTAQIVREDGWCGALACWVFRDGHGRLVTFRDGSHDGPSSPALSSGADEREEP